MHSPFAPSKLATLIACNGSFALSSMFPDYSEESPEAAEGHAAHEVGAAMLTSLRGNSLEVLTPISFKGKKASNGVDITDDITDSAFEYCNAVAKLSNSRGLSKSLQIEQRVDIPYIHPLCYGTPDCWAYDERSGDLWVWDFKHGFQVVEVFENYQLIAYVCGILDKLGINGVGDQYITVHMVIVQPRAYHREGTTREWVCKGSDLRGYFNVARAAVETVMLGEPRTRAGSHCLFCSARGHCETLQKAVSAVFEYAQAASGIPTEPKAAAIELELLDRAYDLVKARRTGITESIEYQLRKGAAVPFFTMAPHYGRKKWTIDDAQLFAMADGFGVNLRNVKPLTVLQAVNAGFPESLADGFSTTPSTLKLTRDLGNKARMIFNQKV